MREIKFRAWDNYEGKWCFGYEYPSLGGFSLLGEVVLMGEIGKYSLDYYQHIKIMQFTGLKDKKGKEIYEKDIIKMGSDDKLAIVNWSTKFASFVLNRDGWAFSHWFGESCNPEDVEIVGNEFENPELLS